MQNFVKEEEQLKKVEDFKSSLLVGNLGFGLLDMHTALHLNIEMLKSMIIDENKVTDSEIYKSHYLIFEHIAKKNINRFDLMKAFGFNEDEISKLKEKNPDKTLIAKMLIEKFDFDILDKTKTKEEKEVEILLKIANKITPEVNKHLGEGMSFSNEDLNRIINGIIDYFKIDNEYKIAKSELKDYLSLKLYSDAFEIYLKILKETYSKIKKIKINNIRNENMYNFLNTNYPILLDSTNNKLRNDVCHLNYDERGIYTTEQIDEERKIIIIKAITGILAKSIFIVKSFDEWSQIDNRVDNIFNNL